MRKPEGFKTFGLLFIKFTNCFSTPAATTSFAKKGLNGLH
jgi:hypothetical protein